MKTLLATVTILMFLLTISTTFARPRPRPQSPEYANYPSPSPSGGIACDLKVKCQRTETAPGVYTFDCTPQQVCVIQREDILWLKGAGDSQQLNVVIPNYKLEEVIKAAFKSTAGSGTAVNILLKRPQQSTEAEADVSIPEAQAPEVNVEYEPIGPREVIHYPVDRPYRPLSGRIEEP